MKGVSPKRFGPGVDLGTLKTISKLRRDQCDDHDQKGVENFCRIFTPRKEFLTRGGENPLHPPNCETVMIAKSLLARLWRDQRAATAIEYGLIIAMMVIAMISALKGVADENTGMWAVVSSKAAEAHADVH